MDSRRQCVEYGDSGYAVRAGIIEVCKLIELGEIIDNPKLGRKNELEITVADLTGIVAQDIQIAKYALH